MHICFKDAFVFNSTYHCSHSFNLRNFYGFKFVIDFFKKSNAKKLSFIFDFSSNHEINTDDKMNNGQRNCFTKRSFGRIESKVLFLLFHLIRLTMIPNFTHSDIRNKWKVSECYRLMKLIESHSLRGNKLCRSYIFRM